MRRFRCGISAHASLLQARCLWSVAGNDGQMAIVNHNLGAFKDRCRIETITKHQHPVKRPRKKPLSGLERLRKAADRQLAKNKQELVKKLVANAIDGKVDSARFLVALAEKMKQEPEGTKKPWFSMARQFAAEAKWTGPWPDEDDEEKEEEQGTGIGDEGIGNRE